MSTQALATGSDEASVPQPPAPVSKRKASRRRIFKTFFGDRGSEVAPTHAFADGEAAHEATTQLLAALHGDSDGTTTPPTAEVDDDTDDVNARLALNNNYAKGDVSKAVELVRYFRRAFDGALEPILHPAAHLQQLAASAMKAPTKATVPLPSPPLSPSYYRILGSDNFKGVSCYLDSLLFAMFARLPNFEPILYKSFESDEKKENLATFLRLFVNMLRTGKPITTDVTRCLLDAVFAAGWTPAFGRNEQQDAAELFSFITEKLNMPLLTLKVDIVHAGKEVMEDDHKLIHESLLHVPVPGTAEDGPILLEECLELYFANNVQVTRQLERRRTIDSMDSGVQPPTAQRKYSIHYESVEVPFADYVSPDSPNRAQSPKTIYEEQEQEQEQEPNQEQRNGQLAQSNEDDSPALEPSTSVASFPSIATSSHEPPSYDSLFMTDSKYPADVKKGRLSTSSKKNPLWTKNNEITLPAWMFLQLLPFYTDSSLSAGQETDKMSPIAQYFANSRPVLGISLKRYYWSKDGEPKRNDRRVVIPKEIKLPPFVADDNTGSEENIFGTFKLVLESAVFHRGNSLNSGHFVSVASEDAAIGYDESPSSVDSPSEPNTATVTPASTKRNLWRKESSGTADSKRPSANSLWRSRSSRTKGPDITSGSAVIDGQEFSDVSRLTGVEAKSKRWIMFDDLRGFGSKVQEVDFDTVFRDECAYLLFYRMVKEEDDDSPAATPVVSAAPSKDNKMPSIATTGLPEFRTSMDRETITESSLHVGTSSTRSHSDGISTTLPSANTTPRTSLDIPSGSGGVSQVSFDAMSWARGNKSHHHSSLFDRGRDKLRSAPVSPDLRGTSPGPLDAIADGVKLDKKGKVKVFGGRNPWRSSRSRDSRESREGYREEKCSVM